MDVSKETKEAAKAAGDALGKAVKAKDGESFRAFEGAAVRLHKCCQGHYPGGGRSLDMAARRELRHGEPGDCCQAFADYLKALAGGKVEAAAEVPPLEAAKPASTSHTKKG